MPQRNTSINGRAVEIPVSIAEVERENSLNAVSQSGGHAAPLGRQPQTNAVPFKIAVEAGPPEATADAPRSVEEEEGGRWKVLAAPMGLIWNNGAACVALNALLAAAQGLFVKLVNDRIPVFQIVGLRSFCSMILTAVLFWDQRRKSGEPMRMFGDPANYPKLFLRGFFGACAITLSTASLSFLPLGDAESLLFTNTALTAMASVLTGYETVSWSMVVSAIASTGGVLLISKPAFLFGGDDIDGQTLIGIVIALTAAVSATCAFITIRSIGGKEKAMVMSMWFHTVSFFTAVLPMSSGVRSVIPTAGEWAVLITVGVMSFGAQLMLSRGFQLLAPSIGATIKLSQVVHARLASVFILNESLPWNALAGSAVICAGVLTAQFGKKSDSKKEGDQAQVGAVGGVGSVEEAGGVKPESAVRSQATISLQNYLRELGHQESLSHRPQRQNTLRDATQSISYVL